MMFAISWKDGLEHFVLHIHCHVLCLELLDLQSNIDLKDLLGNGTGTFVISLTSFHYYRIHQGSIVTVM